jgi:outer membrane lipoprotein-sorting protein
MKQILVTLFLLLGVGMQAQIPAEVKDILKKCSEKNKHTGGTEVDVNLHVGAVVMSINGTMKLYKKGDKSFSIVKMKVKGEEAYSEKGFDGKTEWEYSKATDSDERDTLIITNNAKPKKGKFSINLGVDKEYKNAKLKTTSKFYEITFTNPLKKDTPKKTILRIVKYTYMLHQMETKVSIATAKMTVTKVKIGVSDDVFVFDPKKYPNAVVVRK